MADEEDEGSNRKIPKPVDFSLKTNLSLNVKCGQCLFFKARANSSFKQPCINLGILSKNTPCKRFAPDAANFNFRSDKVMRILSKVISTIGKDKLDLVASVLAREATTRKKGFHFGQLVFIKAFGGDYVSNYRRAYVVFAERKIVHLASGKNLNSDNMFTASIGINSVLTLDDWKKKRSLLEGRGALKDPHYVNYTRYNPKNKDVFKGIDLPTIDSDFMRTKKSGKKARQPKDPVTNYLNVSVNDDTYDVFQTRG